ncbi:MAG: VWA domain-containing protein [Gaiellaceae bacterium]
MTVTFVSPLAALVGLCALVPAAAWAGRRHLARRTRRAVGLSEPARRTAFAALASIVAMGVLVGLAAAQPVLQRPVTHDVRTDAEVFVVLDVSRSMLAQTGAGSLTRMERAKAAASTIRAAVPTARVGLASITDRLLPHLFPSAAEDVYEATLARSIDVERPPPRGGLLTNATKLDALRAARGLRFFSPSARKRVLVVLTDGESLPVQRARLGSAMVRPPVIETVFVHVWSAGERVYTRTGPEPQYRSDPGSRALLEGLAASTRGSVYGEADVDAAASKVARLLGDGPTATEGEAPRRHRLAPYLATAAFLPLALILWRRDR